MQCSRCLLPQPDNQFSERPDRPGKKRTTCNTCRRNLARGRYLRHKQNSYFKHKSSRAYARSKLLGLSCDLTSEYLESIWTGFCPVLGIPLDTQAPQASANLAELDRFIPNLGYTKGNVAFLSHKANVLKSDGTIGEIRKILTWMESIEKLNTQVGCP